MRKPFTLGILALLLGSILAVELGGVAQLATANDLADYPAWSYRLGSGMDQSVLTKLLETTYLQGTEVAIDELIALRASGRNELDGHEYTHILGRYSYLRYREPALAFAHCRMNFDQGCYHGVVEAHLASKPLSKSELPQLCSRVFQENKESGVEDQCWHGVGHALQSILQDTAAALSYCDSLQGGALYACWNAVFMEFTVDEKRAKNERRASSPINAERPLGVCDDSQERYRKTCYRTVSAVLLTLYAGDVPQAAEACRKIPAPFQNDCFFGIGTIVRTSEPGSPGVLTRALSTCAALGAGAAGCGFGVVSGGGIPFEAVAAFCTVTDLSVKEGCYQLVGSRIRLQVAAATRSTACAALEKNYVSACLRGVEGAQ